MLGRLQRFRRPHCRHSALRLERLEDRATPAALTPAQVRHAYGFDQVAAVNGTALTGAGTTIAIVDAYNDPYIASDLARFDAAYGLQAPPSFKVVSQTGSTTSLPQNNSGWAGEIALDVEWAHAIAPGANILLVEARSASTSDLLQAVDYARSQPGVVAVSMSWGGSEFSSETGSINSHFTTPAGHTGLAFVASSGDSGAGAIWPAVSTNVLAVGGTTLNLSGGGYGSESAWNGSGGGPSWYFSKPGYQTAYSGASRGSPDVSYNANPNTGFSVYNTYDGGWEQVGGTSAGAPQWAALVAIADQGRMLQGHGTLDGGTQLLPAIYSMPASNFHDVTSGSNGYAAKSGYDLSTGRGSPIARSVVGSLIGYGYTTTVSTGGTTTTTSGSTSTTTTSSGGTTTTGGTGTSGSGSTSGGWYWGWGWGWGWWYFGPFSQAASSGRTASATPATSPFTLDLSHTATAGNATTITSANKSTTVEPPTTDLAAGPTGLAWGAVQESTFLAIQSLAEDDFAPIVV